MATADTLQCPHPEVDSHCGDEIAGEEETIPESDQQTRLAHAGISQKHHLQQQQSQAICFVHID
jgi:hypothetical protein